MVTAVLTVHIIVCVAIVIVVLLQRGKGAEVGAVFGGSSQTVFGASGAGGALFKMTWTLAAIFAATSLYLAYASTQRVSGSIFEGHNNLIPKHTMSETTAPAPKAAVPAVPVKPGAPASTPGTSH